MDLPIGRPLDMMTVIEIVGAAMDLNAPLNVATASCEWIRAICCLPDKSSEGLISSGYIDVMLFIFKNRLATSLLLLLFDGLMHLIRFNSATVLAVGPGKIYKSLANFNLFQPCSFSYTLGEMSPVDQYGLIYGKIIELKFHLAFRYDDQFQIGWEYLIGSIATLVGPSPIYNPSIPERFLGLKLVKKIAKTKRLAAYVGDKRFVLACCEMMSDAFVDLKLRERVLDCLLALSRADETSAAVIVVSEKFRNFRPDPGNRRISVLFCEIWENMIYELFKVNSRKMDFRSELFESATHWARLHIGDIIDTIKELLESDEFRIMRASALVLAALVSFMNDILNDFPIALDLVVKRIMSVLETVDVSCFGKLCRALCTIASFMGREWFLRLIDQQGLLMTLHEYGKEELDPEDEQMRIFLCDFIDDQSSAEPLIG
jgi:hypothetical protein